MNERKIPRISEMPRISRIQMVSEELITVDIRAKNHMKYTNDTRFVNNV